jgi:hypothetical protein
VHDAVDGPNVVPAVPPVLEITQGANSQGAVAISFPSVVGANGTWSATGIVVNKSGSGSTITVTAYALCVS